MTEAEARKKWCPFARALFQFEGSAVTINRLYRKADEHCLCIASDCMAWSEAESGSKHGWCGLVNSP